MSVRFFKYLITIPCAVTLGIVSQAMAADRHVYLDTNDNGRLNDCPNPAHNAKGTSNTDDLSYCSGGTQSGKVIGTVSGTTTSGSCTSGGGTVTNLTNGVSADVDGDGTNERIYGHPQACVWNMATSDSCEIHAGTYTEAGARCQKDCGDYSLFAQGTGSRTTELENCGIYDCWFASIGAYGLGPNLTNNGYGTASNPAYIRGANMRGAVDTWDADGDKIPDTLQGEPASYPAILSGDRNDNGAFDQTRQPDATLTGDSFFAVMVGCLADGGAFAGGAPSGLCGDRLESDERGIEIDTNADGVFDTELHEDNTYFGVKNAQYLRIKDLKFTRYNGGNDWAGRQDASTHGTNARIILHGDSRDPGHVVDHIYMVDNDANYSNARDCSVAPGGDNNNSCMKTMWAEIASRTNERCANGLPNMRTEIKNSLIHQSTARLGVWTDQGCPLSFHDNRVVIDHANNPSRLNVITDGAHKANVFYFKDVDRTGVNSPATPEKQLLWNNEFILKNMASDSARFFDIQNFGNSEGSGLGEIWFYGNLVRNDPSVAATDLQKFQAYWCDTADNVTQSHRFYMFNNTFDGRDVGGGWEHDAVCGTRSGAGEILVDRNNVFWDVMNVCADDSSSEFATIRRAFSCNAGASQSPACQNACDSSTKSNWFSDVTTTPNYFNALSLYAPKSGGDLEGLGSCDPDGDGTRGVDYDGNGTNDTTWFDLAGNTVDCSDSSSSISVGAIQLGVGGQGPPPDSPPPVENLRRSDRTGS